MASSRSVDGLESVVAFLLIGISLAAPLAFGAVGEGVFAWIQLAIAIALGLWALRLVIWKRTRLLLVPACFGALLFGVYAVLRYIFGEIEYVGRLEALRVVAMGGFFFLVLNNAYRQSSIYIWLGSLCILGAALSMWGIYQFVTDAETVWGRTIPEVYGRRAGASFVCPNHLAGFLEMLIPVALALALASRLPHAVRIGLGYLAILMMGGVAVTFSRAGWIAAGVGVFGLLAALSTRRNHRIPAIVVAVGLLGSAYWVAKDNEFVARRLNDLGLQEGKVQNVRAYLWGPAVELWKTNPIFGIGPSHYDHRMPEVRDERFQLRAGYVHNDYLQTATEYGVVGLGLCLATVVAVAVGVRRVWGSLQRDEEGLGTRSSSKAAAVLGVGFGVLAMLTHSAFDFNLHIPANALVFVAFLAILAGSVRHGTSRIWVKPEVGARWGIAVLILGVAGLLAFESSHRLQEARAVRLAKTGEFTTFQDQVDAAIAATEIEPSNFDSWTLLGEVYRRKAAQKGPGYQELGAKAIGAYRTALGLNPYDYYVSLRLGMTLDDLGREGEGSAYFERAEALDPNGYYTMNYIGRRYAQNLQPESALEYFRRSKKLRWRDNPMADNYIAALEEELGLEETP